MLNLKSIFKDLKKWMVFSVFLAVLVLFILNFHHFTSIIERSYNLLLPFFYAIGIAYVLNIPMSKIEKLLCANIKKNNIFYKKIRTISISITVLLAIIILVFLILFITPQLVTSIATLINNLSGFLTSLVNNMNDILDFFKIDYDIKAINSENMTVFLTNAGINWDQLLANATKFLSGAGTSIIDQGVSFAQTTTQYFVGFLLSLYLLGSKEMFIKQSKMILTAILDFKSAKIVLSNLDEVNDIFKNFVGGQLLEACIIGILIFIMMLITNMPYAVLISTIVAVMALVPVFGAMLAMSFGFILILSVDPIQAVWFIVLFQSVQLFEGNFLYPKVVGDSVGLPAIWTLVSIILFGGLMGIAGMLIAVPLTASLYTIGSKILKNILDKKRKIEDINELLD